MAHAKQPKLQGRINALPAFGTVPFPQTSFSRVSPLLLCEENDRSMCHKSRARRVIKFNLTEDEREKEGACQ